MRFLVAVTSCFFLLVSQAQACRGQGDTLFFEATPNPQPDADVIVKVTLSDVSVSEFIKGIATAKVLQVLMAPDKKLSQGSIVTMKYMVSSCGPDPINGSEGIIIAKAGTDAEGRFVLYPYTRRHEDGRITAPCIGRLSGQITDSCVHNR
jgi:hypothetical protein